MEEVSGLSVTMLKFLLKMILLICLLGDGWVWRVLWYPVLPLKNLVKENHLKKEYLINLGTLTPSGLIHNLWSSLIIFAYCPFKRLFFSTYMFSVLNINLTFDKGYRPKLSYIFLLLGTGIVLVLVYLCNALISSNNYGNLTKPFSCWCYD